MINSTARSQKGDDGQTILPVLLVDPTDKKTVEEKKEKGGDYKHPVHDGPVQLVGRGDDDRGPIGKGPI